jgi:type IV pilus biogenesis protein CpaD/CtpE
MKRMIRIAVLSLAGASTLLMAGCATTEPLWFIATPGYVDSRIALSEEAVRQEYEQSIARLEAELADQRATAEELAALAEMIEEIDASNRELLGLAETLEDRLEDLPRETIAQLVEILEAYLAEGELRR